MEIADLYRRHGAMVFRRARAILGSDAAASDAMQEVFVKAIDAGAEFRGESSPVTWLYRITTNLCLNQIRDEKRRRELLALQGPPSEAQEGGGPEARVGLVELLADVPRDQQVIAVYYYLDRMSHDEIAQILGVSRRTVGNRLAAFRQTAGLDEPADEAAG